VPLSAFVRDVILREAENVMATALTITLSVEESRRFPKVLDAPFHGHACILGQYSLSAAQLLLTDLARGRSKAPPQLSGAGRPDGATGNFKR